MHRTNLRRQHTEGMRARTSFATPTRWASVPVTRHERQDATQNSSASFLEDAKRARARRRLRGAVTAVMISNRYTERFSLDPPGVPASALTFDGKTYQLGDFERQQSVTSIKQRLAQVQEISFANMALYLIEDVRSEDDDLRLKNSETVEEILQYLPRETSALELQVLPVDQCDILVEVRDGLVYQDGGEGVGFKRGWDTLEEHRDLGRCQGVSINEFGEIIGIDLARSNLQGESK